MTDTNHSRYGRTVETAACAACGTAFRRGTRQRWKKLCLSCYAWAQAAKAHEQQRRWLRLTK